jgi:hypothetical protein
MLRAKEIESIQPWRKPRARVEMWGHSTLSCQAISHISVKIQPLFSTNGGGSGLGLSPPGAACDGSMPILHQLFPPILTSHKRFFDVPSGVMSQEIRSPVGEAASFPTQRGLSPC